MISRYWKIRISVVAFTLAFGLCSVFVGGTRRTAAQIILDCGVNDKLGRREQSFSKAHAPLELPVFTPGGPLGGSFAITVTLIKPGATYRSSGGV